MSDVWYLFDPDHPARAEQVMQRVRRERWTLVVEQGTFAGWEVVSSTTMSSPSRLRGFLAEARERGLAVERDPLEVFERLSVRHPELEAAIQAVDSLHSAEGRAALEVYADFLQAQGDARGTLAAMQLRDPYDRATRQWIAEHGAQLFGPLATSGGLPELGWTGGWITEITVAAYPSSNTVRLAHVLRLPACACLRSLEGTWEMVRRGLSRCCATLRRLVLDDLAGQGLDLGELPRLDELILRLYRGSPRRLSLTSARTPKLFLYAEDLTTIHRFLDTVSFGPLERFGFRIPWASRPEHLHALLGHAALRSLREIALIWDTPRHDDVPFDLGPLGGPLLDALLEAPLMHRLELRDLGELEVAEPQRVLDAFASAPGHTIVCSREQAELARILRRSE